jgi:hypothetical protein
MSLNSFQNAGESVFVLGLDQLPDLLLDLVRFWKPIHGLFGEDLLPVEKDLERSGFTRGNRHALDLIVVIVQQVLRQTGGSRQIPSGGAVLDPHRRFRPIRGIGHVFSSSHP